MWRYARVRKPDKKQPPRPGHRQSQSGSGSLKKVRVLAMQTLTDNPTITELVGAVRSLQRKVQELEACTSEWLTTNEAGKRLGNLSGAAMAARCSRGQIKAEHRRRDNGRWLIHRDYINAQAQRKGLTT